MDCAYLTAYTAHDVPGQIVLKPGDVFASSLPGALGWLIRLGEKAQADDNEASYSHTGIILDSQGTTFEALWTVRRQNLFEAYRNGTVLIARYKGMDLPAFNRGYKTVKTQEGKIYPAWRLFLHALNIGKLHVVNRQVCSELTALFLIAAGAQTLGGRNCYGITPDELVDEWRISKHFDVIYEGKI